MKYKVYIPFFFICFFISGSLIAQNESPADSGKINALERGSWSVQFKISSNFTLSSFDGANISAKYHLSPNSAVRLGISIGANNRSSDLETESSSYQYETRDIDDISIAIKPLYLYYPYVNKSVVIFFGTGPYLAYDYKNLDQNRKFYQIDTLTYIENRNQNAKKYSIGVSLVAGVEIFILDYLSLHAEYSSNFYYTDYKTKINTERDYKNSDQANDVLKNTSNENGYVFQPESVLFGLSIYF